MAQRNIGVRNEVYEALKELKGAKSFSDFFEEAFAIGFERYDCWGLLSMKSGEQIDLTFANSNGYRMTLDRLSKLQKVKAFSIDEYLKGDERMSGYFRITIP